MTAIPHDAASRAAAIHAAGKVIQDAIRRDKAASLHETTAPADPDCSATRDGLTTSNGTGISAPAKTDQATLRAVYYTLAEVAASLRERGVLGGQS